jgi:hypothetical protein
MQLKVHKGLPKGLETALFQKEKNIYQMLKNIIG